ncbi:MAG: thioesterase [Proteobacteria bacterium]|nr:thioesterase [Pseudomonadota bacterium]
MNSAQEHYRKLEQMYSKAPINQYFAPQLTVEEGKAELRIAVREDFFHSAGAMHGVIYFKALDDATYFAANSLVMDVFVLTARFEIEFLRPVSQGTIRAVGTVVEDDGHRIKALGELFDDNQKLVGRGEGFFARSKISLESVSDYQM